MLYAAIMFVCLVYVPASMSFTTSVLLVIFTVTMTAASGSAGGSLFLVFYLFSLKTACTAYFSIVHKCQCTICLRATCLFQHLGSHNFVDILESS